MPRFLLTLPAVHALRCRAAFRAHPCIRGFHALRPVSYTHLDVYKRQVLFVGTKKQAQEAVADAANRCGMPYVNARWLGGMLTNFVTCLLYTSRCV